MAQNASVPAETDILCEHCGYGLNGLPTDGRCPECGELIADSTVGDGRTLPVWESRIGSAGSRFFRTTKDIIVSPATFFRHLETRVTSDQSKAFANRQHWLVATILGLTAAIHSNAMGLDTLFDGPQKGINAITSCMFWMIPYGLSTRLALNLITRLASALTTWEGGFWGYRLPPAVVRRVMNFHSAQLLPVSLVGFLTVATYRALLATNILGGLSGVPYLVTISIEVLLGAGYLFRTYWIAMKNIMYANR